MPTISVDVDLEDEIGSMSKSELAELRRCIDRRLGYSGDVVCDNPDRAYAALRHLRRGEVKEALAELEHAFASATSDAELHRKFDAWKQGNVTSQSAERAQ